MDLLLRSTYLSAALSLLYIFLLYRSHPYRRLPAPATLLAFVVGMLSVVLVIAFRERVAIPPIDETLGALLAAAAVEEGAKLLAASVTVFRFRFPNVAEPLDIMLYLGIVGVGFGIYEDFWYIFATSYPSWIAGDPGRFAEVFRGIILARALPGHILFNAISGFLLGIAFFARGRRRWMLGTAGIAAAVLLHAGFNLIAGWDQPLLLLTYAVILVGAFLGLRRWASARSPFAAVIRHVEDAAAWTGERSAVSMLLAEGFAWPGKGRGGLFQFYPVILSLCVLFPLLILGVYFTSRVLIALL